MNIRGLVKSILPRDQIKFDTFMQELESFSRRNLINIKTHKRGKTRHKHTLCKSCLKAHALSIARNLGLQRLYWQIRNVPIKTGHNGFYMDKMRIMMVV